MYIYNNVSNSVNVVRFSEESIQIYSPESADPPGFVKLHGEFQLIIYMSDPKMYFFGFTLSLSLSLSLSLMRFCWTGKVSYKLLIMVKHLADNKPNVSVKRLVETKNRDKRELMSDLHSTNMT